MACSRAIINMKIVKPYFSQRFVVKITYHPVATGDYITYSGLLIPLKSYYSSSFANLKDVTDFLSGVASGKCVKCGNDKYCCEKI